MRYKTITLVMVLVSLFAIAKTDEPTPIVYSPFQLGNASASPIRIKIYDREFVNEDGTPKSSVSPDLKLYKRSVSGTLFVNPYMEKPSLTPFTIAVNCTVTYKTSASSGTLPPKVYPLTINYSPTDGSYRAKDFFKIDDAVWADVTITKISSSPASFIDGDSTFKLYLQYQAEKFVTPTSAQITTPPSVVDFKLSTNKGYLRFTWEEIDWAERYDIEYLFVDNYRAAGEAKPASSIPYNFRFNSTRISTQNNEIEIPVVFEQGYIIARVRAVGVQGANFDEPVYGNWDLPTSGNSLPADSKHSFQVTAGLTHEGDKLNWQYTGTFAGDDLRRDGVTYMDATLRTRQVVSTAHTDQNLLVSETIYDHQGRPAIQTLPAPVKPLLSSGGSTVTIGGTGGNPFENPLVINGLIQPGVTLDLSAFNDIFYYKSTQPKIGFQKNFNRNSDDQPYNKSDFDTDRDECNTSPEPFSSSSGAGKYYSPNSADKTGFNSFIPDGQGYPFTQITYTPDKTNRPVSISKAGPDLKIGSGHEQKIFYGTPSQDEMDRMFGTDAGDASRYKKEMLQDENGQMHVSYKDIKGNIVATALAGSAPQAYAEIPKGDSVNITLHLIEEDNHLDEATQSLVSQKSLLLSKTTTLRFDYALTPPTLSGNYCSGGSYCYDCVYDLEIVVRNSCGDSLWGRKQTIGSLSPINSCNASPVGFNGTVPGLTPGNYFISKRLTVNANAVQSYVENFRSNNLCVRAAEMFYPAAGLGPGSNPCISDCNKCEQIPVTPPRSYAMTQPDGSTRMVSIPQFQQAANDGTCMPVCYAHFPSPCEAGMTAMLADVSPGGQYAEYRDTTYRDEANPSGVFAPKMFPVSLMNDSANALPITNANWRNPAYDYQDEDGSTAYIEIQPDGMPAHRNIEILESDGRQYVKPKYLEYTEDFIRYWKPNWAKSLVVYHPEYAYYIWCISHQSTFDFDTLLSSVKTYAEASNRNLTNRTAADPFFVEEPTALPAMNNALNNFAPLTGFTDFTVEEATYAAVNCNNTNFSVSDLNSCARGRVLYLNAITADKEWNFYKEFYRLKRNKVRDDVRRNWIRTNYFFDNGQIGTNTMDGVSHPLYADRVKRFNDSNDGMASLPTDIDTITVETLLEWRNAAIAEMNEKCGSCASSYDLTAWLNTLTLEKKLKQSLTLPSVTPLTFSRPFTRYFADSLSLRYEWQAEVTTNNLKFTVSTTRGTQCVINLSKTKPYDWDSIVRLDCFKSTGANSFTIRATTALDSTFDINGSSSCMNFRDCPTPRICTKTTAADDMAVFMKYLFQRGRYRNTNLTLRGRRGYTPYLGAGLREAAPNAYLWKWKMKTISPAENEMTATLEVWDTSFAPNPLYDNLRVVLCPFTLRVLTPGFSFNQVADIINISRPSTSTQCSVLDFILTAKTSSGAVFKIYGTSCYKLFDCCHSSNQSSRVICCLPSIPKFNVQPTCLRDAEAVAENNRARDAEDRLSAAADSFRINLMQHCLAAAETFNASYSDAVYHVTLMYYDRSGQLVKTVPPAGVHLLNRDSIDMVRAARAAGTSVSPKHSMVTTYRYNSFNQLVEKNSPDEGRTRFCYDEVGRAIMSQDASQLEANAATYTLYDNVGRITESGRRSHAGAIPYFQSYSDFAGSSSGSWSSTKSEVKKTKYDVMPAGAASLFSPPAKKLRNRVAAVEAYETGSALSHAMYFDYDALGNTKNLVQHFKTIPVSGGAGVVKRVSYDYNPVSGKVKRVWYQKDNTDQLIHWYQYDADGRMTIAQTGTNPNELEILRETEARYYYYQHGPLARVELGTEKIQGIDYAYTINGMLKTINSGNCNTTFDMGKDGTTESDRHFAPDIFGESLNFFSGDYSPVSEDAIQFYTTSSGLLETGFSKPLYNGFIRSTVSAIPSISTTPMARAYRYDQAGRLEQMQTIFDVGTAATNQVTAGFGEDYKMQLSYDANGNISTLLRKKQSGGSMDNLTYRYNNGNNQLNHLEETVPPTSSDDDLDAQDNNNYLYDASGRIKQDGNKQMLWSNSGRIKEVRNAYAGNLQYGYDAFDRRMWEKRNGVLTDFYVNDAAGNRMASYKISGSVVTCHAISIYGASRLGEYELNREARSVVSDSSNFYRGLKRYEIVNHIGDVQVVVTDKRLRVGEDVKASVVMATDYYPFGMVMPGRKTGDRNYRYGFQGMESDDDVANDDNEYTTEFRQYDPRVGRWMSVDPADAKYPDLSPYVAYLNNPISFTDAKGDDVLTARQFERRIADVAVREMEAMEGMSMEEMYEHIAAELLEDGELLVIDMPEGALESSEDHVHRYANVEELSTAIQENTSDAVGFIHEVLESYFSLQLANRLIEVRDAARRGSPLPARRGRAGTAARARYDRYARARLDAGRRAASAERAAAHATPRARMMRGIGNALGVLGTLSTASDIYQIYCDWTAGREGHALAGGIGIGLDVAGAALLTAGWYTTAGGVMVFAEVSGFGGSISTAGDSYNAFYREGFSTYEANIIIDMVNTVNRIRQEHINEDVAPSRMTTGGGSSGRRR